MLPLPLAIDAHLDHLPVLIYPPPPALHWLPSKSPSRRHFGSNQVQDDDEDADEDEDKQPT